MAKANNGKKGVSKENVDQFKMLYPMLDGVLNEMRELSKKKQDGVLNKLKAKTINRILEKIKVLLHEEPSIEFLELLDEDTLPTNSDAVLMIVQFKSAMDGYKTKNQRYESGTYKWIVNE